MGGGGPSFGSFGSPGFVSPFDMNAVDLGQGSSEQAMTNRYAQLGLSATGATPHSRGGPAGGIGVGGIGAGGAGAPASAPGTPPPVTAGETTAEMMDLGQAPSLGGGIPKQFEAVMGMIQNANLANASMSGGGGGGGKGGGGGGKGGAGMLLPLMMGGK